MDKTIEQQPRAEGGRMNAEQRLLPCPWCRKSDAMLWLPTCDKATPYDPSHRAFPVVRCSCGIQREGRDWDQTGQSAITAWNTRPAPTEAEVEAAVARMADIPTCDCMTRAELTSMARAALGVG